jgi:serine/threonine protein phosphatase PrpC
VSPSIKVKPSQVDGHATVLTQDAIDFVLEKYNKLIKDKKILTNFKAKSEQNIANKLADYAIAKGSLDNISLYILFFTDHM